uniref:Uncharacterized protein C10orf62 homolog n=1 Tax=Castor canadensis TaxID=51338 RepID=A0A8B7VP27_CASCN|nr:uncharacterized protein C10orf62 homolog [Castor canadensis]
MAKRKVWENASESMMVLETILELLHQPSCKVVLGTLLLLGGGGLVLWAQRKRSRKTFPQPAQDELPESHRANDSWIKSHFSRLSQEKLHHDDYVHANACNDGLQPESGSGEASTTIRMETFTTRRGEGGTALHRESFTSRQRMSGSSMSKETHKELGVSPSMEDATWASVAACVKEIDTQGQHLANSMLQRAAAYQHSGHVESEDINPEELKGLEEVEMKLKGNFFTQRDTTIAGANQAHAFYSHNRHGHQSHQGHPGHQSHPGHKSYQAHPGHQSHQSHPGHQSHQGHPGHSSHQGHPGHPSHQNHPGHPSHQSHSLPNRSHPTYDS